MLTSWNMTLVLWGKAGGGTIVFQGEDFWVGINYVSVLDKCDRLGVFTTQLRADILRGPCLEFSVINPTAASASD